MAMTDEEIASAAARRSAARRRRVSKRCELCGTTFEGLTTKRYCSDRCRVEAARNRARSDPNHLPQPEGPPFDVVLTDEELEQLLSEHDEDFFERLRQIVFGDHVFDTDVVEDLRRADEERSKHFAKLAGR